MADAGFKVVVPARYESSRLPGKPLLDLAGWPMVRHVCARARESGAADVIVATDDERVARACHDFGVRVCMTEPAHESGTERVAEVVAREDDDERVVVNLQGDEPLMPPGLVRQVARALAQDPEADVATACVAIEADAELFDPAVVKVVCDGRGRALYFSRAPIPWHRDEFAARPGRRPPGAHHWRHLGLYAYRAGFLRRYAGLRACESERAERLEQLRVLHHGGRIRVVEATETPGPGVDTQDDLDRVRALLGSRGDAPAHQ